MPTISPPPPPGVVSGFWVTCFPFLFECFVVESCWLAAGGLGVVAGLADAATILWVVGIETHGYEVDSFGRVVVGDCAWFPAESRVSAALAGAGAPGVACEHPDTEPSVASGVVWVAVWPTSGIKGFAAVVASASGLDEVGASWCRAYVPWHGYHLVIWLD